MTTVYKASDEGEYDRFVADDEHPRAVEELWTGMFACYRGTIADGQFNGHHVGLLKTAAEANAFLRGEDVQLLKVEGVSK